jgi:hypothetical protein
MFSGSPGL